MISRPPGVGAFQFVVLATLRAAQLIRGCTPRVEGIHKATVMAMFEVAEGKVLQVFTTPAAITAPVIINGAPVEAAVAMAHRV